MYAPVSPPGANRAQGAGRPVPDRAPTFFALAADALAGQSNAMTLKIATWNINSVRLRIGLVVRFLETWKPDILCLQETKCPQGQFPSSALKDIGYPYLAERGQSGYHGVAIVARMPFEAHTHRLF